MRGKSKLCALGPTVLAMSNGSFEGLKEVGLLARERREDVKDEDAEGRIVGAREGVQR